MGTSLKSTFASHKLILLTVHTEMLMWRRDEETGEVEKAVKTGFKLWEIVIWTHLCGDAHSAGFSEVHLCVLVV